MHEINRLNKSTSHNSIEEHCSLVASPDNSRVVDSKSNIKKCADNSAKSIRTLNCDNNSIDLNKKEEIVNNEESQGVVAPSRFSNLPPDFTKPPPMPNGFGPRGHNSPTQSHHNMRFGHPVNQYFLRNGPGVVNHPRMYHYSFRNNRVSLGYFNTVINE